MEDYYKKLMPFLKGYTVQGLFDGNRTVDKIVTLQTGDQGRVFFFDQEPIIANMDIELWDHVFSEPTILANSELDSEDKQWLADRYPNFVDWYFFSHALVSREWFAHYRYMSAGNYGSPDEKKKLLVDFGLLTDMRQYRIYLFLLLKSTIERHSYYSIDVNQNWKEQLEKNDHFDILTTSPEKLKTLFSDQSVSYDDFGENATHVINSFKQNHISFDHYSKSDFILVLETAFQSRKKHLTEKIFKPIVAGKPFILAGAPENLAYLKSYGFKTFDNFLNETYDNILDNKQRCYSIKDSIKFFSINYENMYSQKKFNQKIADCYEISQFNREWFWSDQFYEIIFNEAINNLDSGMVAESILRNNNCSTLNIEYLKRYNDAFNSDEHPK